MRTLDFSGVPIDVVEAKTETFLKENDYRGQELWVVTVGESHTQDRRGRGGATHPSIFRHQLSVELGDLEDVRMDVVGGGDADDRVE